MGNFLQIQEAWESTSYGVVYSPHYMGYYFMIGYYFAIFMAWGLFHYEGIFSKKGD